MNAGYIPLDHWVHGPEGGGRNIGEACHVYDLFDCARRRASVAERRTAIGDPAVATGSRATTTSRRRSRTPTARSARSPTPRSAAQGPSEGAAGGLRRRQVLTLDDYRSLSVERARRRRAWSSRTIDKGHRAGARGARRVPAPRRPVADLARRSSCARCGSLRGRKAARRAGLTAPARPALDAKAVPSSALGTVGPACGSSATSSASTPRQPIRGRSETRMTSGTAATARCSSGRRAGGALLDIGSGLGAFLARFRRRVRRAGRRRHVGRGGPTRTRAVSGARVRARRRREPRRDQPGRPAVRCGRA